MSANTRSSLLVLFTTLMLSVPISPCMSEGKGKFFLKADLGYSIPSLPNLSSELNLQGDEQLEPGLGCNISLGRAFRDMRWAVEFYFSVSFYPGFDYINEYHENGFRGDLSHYSYACLLKRCLLPGAKSFAPSIGAGAGYGITNLIAGGGKLETFEALAVLQVESSVKDNISLLLEGAYCASLKQESFEKAFLEDLEGDVVQTSDGSPLEDRFTSIEIRAGIVVWLRPPRRY
jgi:hypothetical protein